MIRTSVLCALTSLLLAATGCQESPDQQRRAALDQGKLVAGPEPGFEAAYLADQKQVKLIQRTVPISYEPLDTFRAQAAAKARSGTSAQPSAKPDVAADAGKKGLFGRLKNALTEKVGAAAALLPGGAPAATATPQAETTDPDGSDDEPPDDENLDGGDNEPPDHEDPDGEDEDPLDDDDDELLDDDADDAELEDDADEEELDDEDDEDGDEEPDDDEQDDGEDDEEDEI